MTVKTYLYILLLVLIIGGLVLLYPQIEWSAPQVNIGLESDSISTKPFDIEIVDKGKGLKKTKVELVTDKGSKTLIQKDYPEGVKVDNIEVTLDPKTLGIKEGSAQLIVTTDDRSRIKIFRGNRNKVIKNISLDLTPPKLAVLTPDLYINQGGSGLMIYKSSPDTKASGVWVGDIFFPGHKGHFKDDDIYLSFIAFPFNAKQSDKITVVAEDTAGNTTFSQIPYVLRKVNYRKSNIKISENFINSIMVPLADPEVSGGTLKEIFLNVNNELRAKNNAEIKRVGNESQGKIMWDKAFHQLSNSKVEANFADERTYMLNDEPIDQQYHLGYDLAVTKRYPVEAANSGKIVYADELGIYGNTVIIDHGMGITTLYSHLSTIDVNVDDEVKKKQIIGRTGETGLAAGDHLHYGVYINGVAVRPREWWDPKWVRDNVTSKIKQIAGEVKETAKEDNKTKDQ